MIEKFGGKFSRELGINLPGGESAEIFKWFLASILFGARISEAIAIRTYREFEKQGLLSAESIAARRWRSLVAVLDHGGYARYDYKTATKLLEVCKALQKTYAGDLNALHAAASDEAELQALLRALAKGIGEVTVNIFLREMRGVWSKAEPLPSELVLKAAAGLGLIAAAEQDPRQALAILKRKWTDEGNRLQDFADFEAALLRVGLAMRRRHRPHVGSIAEIPPSA
ncbi:MAG TPA: hypothetical protein VKV05_04995 [Terriglobales bacterium]|nr:hypothetical protein [Terriglobales bacterium]